MLSLTAPASLFDGGEKARWPPGVVAFVRMTGVIGLWMAVAIAQCSLSRSLAPAGASFVQPFEFARVLFAAAAGHILGARFPGAFVWIGSAIVFASVFVLARRRGAAMINPPNP